MRRFFNPRAIATGTGIAVGATALSFALAVYGFENIYYTSVFMPFAMLACVAVAWFSFLRDDGLARRLPEAAATAHGVAGLGARANTTTAAAEPRPAEPFAVSGLGAAIDGASLDGHSPNSVGLAAGRLDPTLFAPRDGSLVSRRAVSAASSAGSGDQTGHRPGSLGREALIWAAAELGAASAVLYAVAGLGARFYR